MLGGNGRQVSVALIRRISWGVYGSEKLPHRDRLPYYPSRQ